MEHEDLLSFEVILPSFIWQKNSARKPFIEGFYKLRERKVEVFFLNF